MLYLVKKNTPVYLISNDSAFQHIMHIDMKFKEPLLSKAVFHNMPQSVKDSIPAEFQQLINADYFMFAVNELVEGSQIQYLLASFRDIIKIV